MCEDKKGCITINCGCCGNNSIPGGVYGYAQLEADSQAITTDKKIYFNDKSFGNLEVTPGGTVVLEPGVYSVFLNCQIVYKGTAGYVTLQYYDLISGKHVGETCTRVSPDFVSKSSCSEGNTLIRVDEKVELCINCAYAEETPFIERVYGNIIRISD